MTDREDAARIAYREKFGTFGPFPHGIDTEKIAQVLERAVEAGKPVDDDFDWWADLPPDAVA